MIEIGCLLARAKLLSKARCRGLNVALAVTLAFCCEVSGDRRVIVNTICPYPDVVGGVIRVADYR